MEHMFTSSFIEVKIMRIAKELISKNFTCVSDLHTLGNAYQSCYVTDLLSAAIKSAGDHAILITLISHENTVALAMMIDLPVIIITEGRTITASMINKCNDENICLIHTHLKNHEVVIDLYQRGLL